MTKKGYLVCRLIALAVLWVKVNVSRRTQAPANVAEKAHKRNRMDRTPRRTPWTMTMMYLGASADETDGSKGPSND